MERKNIASKKRVCTYHIVIEGVGQDLCPPRRCSGIAAVVLDGGPGSWIHRESRIHRRSDRPLHEYPVEHRKTVHNNPSAKTERIHKSGREHRGVTCVAERKRPL